MRLDAAQRKIVFDAVKALRNGQRYTKAEVQLLDAALDAALDALTPPAPRRAVSAKGIDLIHSFEACRLQAYPDPGSKDGHPWTIGWGSTGPGIHKGVTWTQQEADERFAKDIACFAAKVDEMLGDAPTTQNQFDALCSLAYNIGLKGLRGSTVLRLHKAGDHTGAARAFLMWNKNDGKVMRGLTRRRLAEADLYDDE